MDEQVEKLAAVWYEQGRIIGLGIRDSLAGEVKEGSLRDSLRSRFGLKTAADGGGNNYGGIGDANPTAPPSTPSNDSSEKQESSNVVKDEKAEQNLPEGELAQGHVGETANGEPKEAGMAGLVEKGTKWLAKKDKQVASFINHKPRKALAIGAAATVGAGAVGTGVGLAAGSKKEAAGNPFTDAIL